MLTVQRRHYKSHQHKFLILYSTIERKLRSKVCISITQARKHPVRKKANRWQNIPLVGTFMEI